MVLKELLWVTDGNLIIVALYYFEYHFKNVSQNLLIDQLYISYFHHLQELQQVQDILGWDMVKTTNP